MPKNDNTGVPQTCPYIDEVIAFIEAIKWQEGQEDDAQTVIEICKTLEKIRSMNTDLRDFGNQEYKRAEEAESDRDYYEKQVKSLEDEVENLKNLVDS
jgi:benzoyl-CoA reductase/2-hydroxyglutaryl-CoA dehydratase subunit BcrC/BadD/HgdB